MIALSMKTLVIHIKNKRDSKFIEEFLDRVGVEVDSKNQKLPQQLPKSKFKSEEDFRSFAGIAKGQLISKQHLRNLSWKKREW